PEWRSFRERGVGNLLRGEKKFNNTWEGDSVGNVRLLALLDQVELDQVPRTGERARRGLEAAAGEYPQMLTQGRGSSVSVGIVDLTPAGFEAHKLQILAVEEERYGGTGHYRPGVRRTGRPLLQFPLETLESTASNPRAIGIALRDRVSARLVGYALGSALENH